MHQRLSGRQITTVVVAVCVAVIAFPVGVLAATGSLVNITDPVHKSNKARVDNGGRLYVGDGGGSLTVDGTVNGRPVAPARTWSNVAAFNNFDNSVLVGPTASAIDLSGVSATLGGASNTTSVSFYIAAKKTTTDCDTSPPALILWDGYINSSTTIAAALPTPIRWQPPSGSKGCLFVVAGPINNGATLVVNASGFLG
jgi:hypothetical protein